MKLPTLPRPKYESSITGIDGTFVYTPFSIADKRNLLSAISFKDPKAFIQTVVDIVKANTNLEELGAMQLHYIEAAFMKVYAASMGGVIEADYTCSAEVEVPAQPAKDATDTEPAKEAVAAHTRICGTVTAIRIPIDDIELDYGDLRPGKEHVVQLSDDDAVTLAIPNWDEMQKYLSDDKTVDISDEFVLSCIVSVSTPDAVLTREDFTEEELQKWIEALDSQAGDKFGVFFSNIPVIQKTLNVKCPKCQSERLLVLRGIDDFFV